MSDGEQTIIGTEQTGPTEDAATEQTSSAGQSSLSPEVRQRLIQQFEAWLDRMDAGEPPPAGLPAELLAELGDEADGAASDCDLYTLFSGLTTLSGEIRLQGRAFKQLVDALAPLGQLPQQFERLEKSVTPPSEAGGLPVSSDEVCSVMLDLYDRLNRGLETCDQGIASLRQRQRRGWLRRLLGRGGASDEAMASAEALRDAAALTLARLDAIFDQWGIERIGQIGMSFDPQRMTAVHVRPSDEFEPGTVLEVNRSGYALHGQMKLTAQVTVARVTTPSE